MSTKTIIQTLFAYTWHTNSRLLEQAAQLADADFQEKPGFGRGSMHEIFFHLLKTSNNWRQGIETGKRSYALNAEDYPTLASIQAGFQKEQAAWQAFLEALSAEDEEGDVTITRRSGEVEYVPRWRILHHLALHGMQHHAELALMLTQKGKSPGDIDFIFYK